MFKNIRTFQRATVPVYRSGSKMCLAKSSRSYHVNEDGIHSSKYPDVTIPTDATLPEFIMGTSFSSNSYGEDVALKYKDKDLTYNQLNQHTYKIADALQNSYKLQKNDKVLLMMPNSIEFAIAKYGILQAGGICSAANPASTPTEIAHYLNLLKCDYIIVDKAFYVNVLEGIQLSNIKSVKNIIVADINSSKIGYAALDGLDLANKDVSSLESLLGNNGENIERRFGSNIGSDVACIPFSSGTTGAPKGVQLTHTNLISNIAQIDLEDIHHTPRGIRNLGVLPFWHIYGMTTILNHPLYNGVCTTLMSHFDPAEFLTIIQQHKIEKANIVPPILQFLSKNPIVQKFDLSSMTEVTCAAAPLSAITSSEYLNAHPYVKFLRQGYGMTELSPVCHMDSKESTVLGSVGVLIPNTQMKLIDNKGEVIKSEGLEGEICIKGPQVMLGYLDNEKATKDTMTADGFLKTGDVGKQTNGHLFITDRAKELIKVSGHQVAPAELESIILQHPSITDVCVVDKPDERAGELPVAYIVLKDQLNDKVTDEEIMGFANKDIASYKHIAEIKRIDAIPRNTSGKILRRFLRDELKELAKKKAQGTA